MKIRRDIFDMVKKLEYSLLLFLLWQLDLITTHDIALEGRFKSCPGKRLPQDVILSWNSSSAIHCSAICIMETDCFGFNVIFQAVNTYKCEVLSSVLLIASCDHNTLSPEDGTDFYIKGKLYLFLLHLLITECRFMLISKIWPLILPWIRVALKQVDYLAN